MSTVTRSTMPARRLAGTAAVVLAALCAVAVGSSTAAASTTSGTTPPAAVQVVPVASSTEPAPEEPTVAQFADGVPYVAPTQTPATDIGASRARALTAGTYACTGYGSVDDNTPLSQVLKDQYSWADFPTTRIGDGSGNINWRLNPYKNPSWYMWMHSLRWMGQGIIAAQAGDLVALDHVKAIARDWVKDNPYSWQSDLGAYESTQNRANVLICLRQAIIANTPDQQLPDADAWIDAALRDHASFLIAHWSGAWNHGTDESMALFGVGCLLGDADYRALAVKRLSEGITTNIDAQGATNEQATAYGHYNYSQWGRAVDVLRACNTDPGETIQERRRLLAIWLAQATDSTGHLHQIGDSEQFTTESFPGTPTEYVASGGATGTPPTDRVAVYDQGYVFGRTGWGTGDRTYAQESTYSIRFGPKRAVHGHNDHMGITYTSRGRPILVDAGHAGYQPDQWRTWVRSESGHSALTTPTGTELLPATTLTRKLVTDTSDFYEFRDVPASGVTRTRGVLFLKDPDLLITLDRAGATRAQQFQTLWHLPSDQAASVYSRTTAIAQAPGSNTRTILFQIPYRQALPPGAILLKRGQTSPIQGWQYPDIWTRNAAPTLQLSRSGTSASILSIVAPVRASAGVLYKVRQVGTSTVIDLTVAGKPVSVLISNGGGLVRM
jgi:hypothetical protein